MNAFAQRVLLPLIALLGIAAGAQAFNGPFTQFVNVAPGVDLDVDVRLKSAQVRELTRGRLGGWVIVQPSDVAKIDGVHVVRVRSTRSRHARCGEKSSDDLRQI